jgi:hypothetical protein
MLIKGRYKTLGFWYSVIGLVAGLILLLFAIFKGTGIKPFVGNLLLFVTLAVLIGTCWRLLSDAHLILIDTEKKIITFTNRFIRVSKNYNFSDFSGKLVSYEPIIGGAVKNIYLIKDKKAEKKITEFIYSNQKELEEALREVKDLGSFKYSHLKSLKISLGLPILE